MQMVVLDRFNGGNDAEGWILRAEQYFLYLGFSEKDWLPLPSLYLDGEALEWFRWMFRNNQFFDWNHFKEKLALSFPKQTYAKYSVVDAQLTNILALLQKLEDKYSFVSPQVRVKDTRISVASAFSNKIASPVAEENSSPGVEGYLELFDTFVDEHSIHVDHMFDEISNEVFTKEVEETSSASSFLADSEVIQSPKVFNDLLHSCCPKTIAEVQLETTIKIVDEEALGPERSALQLFDEYSPRDLSKRYIPALSLNRGSSKQKIEFGTFDDMYLPKFSLEPDTFKDLNHDNFFLKIEASITPSNMPSDEMLLAGKHGKSRDEFNAYNILSQFSYNPCVNSSTVSVHGTAMNPCVWDPGIRLNSMAPTGYTDTTNVDLLQFWGATDMFCLIPYANSTSQVWDPGRQLSWNSYIVEMTENRVVGEVITGISRTTIEGNTADSHKEGSQSFREGLHSTTNTSTLVSTGDCKYLVNCLALPRRTSNMVIITKGHTKVVEQSYLQHLQVQSLGQRDMKLWVLLLILSYYELLEPNMQTLFKLSTEASDNEEDVVAFQAIELQSKVPMFDGLQRCKKKFSFRWINHLRLGLNISMFSLKEEELIVSIYGIFEQKRSQITTHLTETSQDQLVRLFSLAPTVPIHYYGLLVAEYVRFGSRYAIDEITGCVMWGKILYLFGDRGALCFSELFFPMWWLVIIFCRKVLWFDIGSVLMGYGVWVILFLVPTCITKITLKHFRDAFSIINHLMICCGGSCFLRDSPRWLTKATHWKVKVVASYAIIFVLVTEKYISFLSILEGYVNNITPTGAVSAYGTTNFFRISKWTYQPMASAHVKVSIATLSCVSLSFIVEFPYSNLEDKVLIEDESIVMNHVQPNMDTKVTQVVIGLRRAIGSITSNKARLIWDPG